MLDYWKDKNKRAEDAEKHIYDMRWKYKPYIDSCIENSIVYDVFDPSMMDMTLIGSVDKTTDLIVRDLDSCSAIFEYSGIIGERTCVLNFASYRNPGGMYKKGSSAQEECLCSDSFLYNVLSAKRFRKEFYSKHNDGYYKNSYIYRSDMIYTPDVMFESERDVITCDVITCAAPNYRAYSLYADKETKPEISAVYSELRTRIIGILYHALENNVDNIILGAFGCGVFMNDPFLVALTFKSVIDEYFDNKFKSIIFAVPVLQGDNRVFNTFWHVLHKLYQESKL